MKKNPQSDTLLFSINDQAQNKDLLKAGHTVHEVLLGPGHVAGP